MIKYIIFDFDGTIANTLPILEKIGKDIAKTHKINISSEDAREIGLKKAILKSKFPLRKLPKLVKETRKQMSEYVITDAKPISDIDLVLHKLSKKYSLGILSSNSEENVKRFLQKYNLKRFFEFIYSGSSLFGKHIVLNKLSKKFKIKKSEMTYIGDEDRDIIAAKRAGIKNIAVTWGVNNITPLKKVKPDHLIFNPKQLPDLLL